MANTRHCIFEDATKNIDSIVDLNDSTTISQYLTNLNSNTNNTLIAFEIVESTNVQEPHPSTHVVNSTNDGFTARSVTDPNHPAYNDGQAPEAVPNLFQWWFTGQPNTVSNLNSTNTSLLTYPVVGAPDFEQHLITSWEKELVDEGNSTIPNGNTYTTEQITYTPVVDELVEFHVELNTRESNVYTYMAGSVIVIEAWIEIQEVSGSQTVVYRGNKHPIVMLKDTSLDRQFFIDTALVHLDAGTQYHIKLQTQARFQIPANNLSTLGIATEYMKITKKLVS